MSSNPQLPPIRLENVSEIAQKIASIPLSPAEARHRLGAILQGAIYYSEEFMKPMYKSPNLIDLFKQGVDHLRKAIAQDNVDLNASLRVRPITRDFEYTNPCLATIERKAQKLQREKIRRYKGNSKAARANPKSMCNKRSYMIVTADIPPGFEWKKYHKKEWEVARGRYLLRNQFGAGPHLFLLEPFFAYLHIPEVRKAKPLDKSQHEPLLLQYLRENNIPFKVWPVTEFDGTIPEARNNKEDFWTAIGKFPVDNIDFPLFAAETIQIYQNLITASVSGMFYVQTPEWKAYIDKFVPSQKVIPPKDYVKTGSMMRTNAANPPQKGEVRIGPSSSPEQIRANIQKRKLKQKLANFVPQKKIDQPEYRLLSDAIPMEGSLRVPFPRKVDRGNFIIQLLEKGPILATFGLLTLRYIASVTPVCANDGRPWVRSVWQQFGKGPITATLILEAGNERPHDAEKPIPMPFIMAMDFLGIEDNQQKALVEFRKRWAAALQDPETAKTPFSTWIQQAPLAVGLGHILPEEDFEVRWLRPKYGLPEGIPFDFENDNREWEMVKEGFEGKTVAEVWQLLTTPRVIPTTEIFEKDKKPSPEAGVLLLRNPLSLYNMNKYSVHLPNYNAKYEKFKTHQTQDYAQWESLYITRFPHCSPQCFAKGVRALTDLLSKQAGTENSILGLFNSKPSLANLFIEKNIYTHFVDEGQPNPYATGSKAIYCKIYDSTTMRLITTVDWTKIIARDFMAYVRDPAYVVHLYDPISKLIPLVIKPLTLSFKYKTGNIFKNTIPIPTADAKEISTYSNLLRLLNTAKSDQTIRSKYFKGMSNSVFDKLCAIYPNESAPNIEITKKIIQDLKKIAQLQKERTFELSLRNFFNKWAIYELHTLTLRFTKNRAGFILPFSEYSGSNAVNAVDAIKKVWKLLCARIKDLIEIIPFVYGYLQTDPTTNKRKKITRFSSQIESLASSVIFTIKKTTEEGIWDFANNNRFTVFYQSPNQFEMVQTTLKESDFLLVEQIKNSEFLAPLDQAKHQLKTPLISTLTQQSPNIEYDSLIETLFQDGIKGSIPRVFDSYQNSGNANGMTSETLNFGSNELQTFLKHELSTRSPIPELSHILSTIDPTAPAYYFHNKLLKGMIYRLAESIPTSIENIYWIQKWTSVLTYLFQKLQNRIQLQLREINDDFYATYDRWSAYCSLIREASDLSTTFNNQVILNRTKTAEIGALFSEIKLVYDSRLLLLQYKALNWLPTYYRESVYGVQNNSVPYHSYTKDELTRVKKQARFIDYHKSILATYINNIPACSIDLPDAYKLYDMIKLECKRPNNQNAFKTICTSLKTAYEAIKEYLANHPAIEVKEEYKKSEWWKYLFHNIECHHLLAEPSNFNHNIWGNDRIAKIKELRRRVHNYIQNFLDNKTYSFIDSEIIHQFDQLQLHPYLSSKKPLLHDPSYPTPSEKMMDVLSDPLKMENLWGRIIKIETIVDGKEEVIDNSPSSAEIMEFFRARHTNPKVLNDNADADTDRLVKMQNILQFFQTYYGWTDFQSEKDIEDKFEIIKARVMQIKELRAKLKMRKIPIPIKETRVGRRVLFFEYQKVAGFIYLDRRNPARIQRSTVKIDGKSYKSLYEDCVALIKKPKRSKQTYWTILGRKILSDPNLTNFVYNSSTLSIPFDQANDFRYIVYYENAKNDLPDPQVAGKIDPAVTQEKPNGVFYIYTGLRIIPKEQVQLTIEKAAILNRADEIEKELIKNPQYQKEKGTKTNNSADRISKINNNISTSKLNLSKESIAKIAQIVSEYQNISKKIEDMPKTKNQYYLCGVKIKKSKSDLYQGLLHFKDCYKDPQANFYKEVQVGAQLIKIYRIAPASKDTTLALKITKLQTLFSKLQPYITRYNLHWPNFLASSDEYNLLNIGHQLHIAPTQFDPQGSIDFANTVLNAIKSEDWSKCYSKTGQSTYETQLKQLSPDFLKILNSLTGGDLKQLFKDLNEINSFDYADIETESNLGISSATNLLSEHLSKMVLGEPLIQLQANGNITQVQPWRTIGIYPTANIESEVIEGADLGLVNPVTFTLLGNGIDQSPARQLITTEEKNTNKEAKKRINAALTRNQSRSAYQKDRDQCIQKAQEIIKATRYGNKGQVLSAINAHFLLQDSEGKQKVINNRASKRVAKGMINAARIGAKYLAAKRKFSSNPTEEQIQAIEKEYLDNAPFVRIHYENLKGYRPKKGERYITEKAQWTLGQISNALTYKSQVEGFCTAYISAAYTTKKCSYCKREGQIGFILTKSGDKYYHEKFDLPKFDKWVAVSDLTPSDFSNEEMKVQSWQIEQIDRIIHPNLYFYPTKAGHIFRCINPRCPKVNHFIGRDRGASINIAEDDPFASLLDKFQIHWDRIQLFNPSFVAPNNTASSPPPNTAFSQSIITRHPHNLRKYLINDLFQFYDRLLKAVIVESKEKVLNYIESPHPLPAFPTTASQDSPTISSYVKKAVSIQETIEQIYGSRFNKSRWELFIRNQAKAQELLKYVLWTHYWLQSHGGDQVMDSFSPLLINTFFSIDPTNSNSIDTIKLIIEWRIRLS